MKKIFLCCVFLGMSLMCIYSQDKDILEVEYHVFYDVDIPNTRKGTLLINLKERSSIYFNSENSLSSGISLNEEDSRIAIVDGSDDIEFVRMYDKTNEIIYSDFHRKDTYLITDTIQDYTWDTSYTETKKIGNILCNKATLDFRGRKYIAWYDPNYNVNFGPWKFRNTPGLIINVYDQTETYNWTVTKINYVTSDKYLIEFDEEKFKNISLYDFVQLIEIKDPLNVSNSKLPRGGTVKVTYYFRNGMETKYEWEPEK